MNRSPRVATYCVLHIADFALQAVLRTETVRHHGPAALFSDRTKKSIVLSANTAARRAGVELGMTAPQAVARCPALLIRVPRTDAEQEGRAALLAVGFTVAPTVEDTAPGVCTIDLKGSTLPMSRRATDAAVMHLAALGLAATAGLAETPTTALYAARAAASANESDEVSAETPAAREARVFVVTDPAGFLSPLPLSAADPPAAIADVLHRWGLRTFGDLTRLPRDDVGRRLGIEGIALWDRARGGAPRPLNPVALPQSFSAHVDFEDDIETLEPLLFMLRRFLERLTLELRASNFVAAAIHLGLRLADDTKHERSFRVPEPTADVEILFRALHTHLEGLRTDAPIVSLHLELSPTRPLVRQHGLFDTGLRDPHGFAETLARVVAIVGSERVGTPQTADTHRPDTVTLRPPPPVIPAPTEPPLHPLLGPPLRRYRPPLSADVETDHDGRPASLSTARFHGRIISVAGPWLSSGNWWQSDGAWRRAEYDVALAGGGLFRLVQTGGEWFVDGEYD